MLSPHPDPTRDKLVAAAGQVFAEQGYQAATVREICALAGANVAAVNYHFGDKMGLYHEVLRESMCSVRPTFWEETECGGPEQAIRQSIREMLLRMNAGERTAWAFRIMAHEMAQPTPALCNVIKEVIRPNHERLRVLLGQLLHLPPDHERTRFCAHSIVAQIMHYIHARPVIGQLWPELTAEPNDLDRIAAHIADFSLSAVHAFSERDKSK